MTERKSKFEVTCSDCGQKLAAGTTFHSEQEGLTEYIQCQSCHEAQLEADAAEMERRREDDVQ
jgi:DNA-directed RNA polymerase subunit RPC12/RpoP